MRWLCAWLFCLALPGLAAAQPFPALYDVTGVDGDDVLNIRGYSDPEALIIGELAPDATGVEVTGLDISGRWGQINTGEGTGWIAMRFMTRADGPGWQAGAAPLHCFGTEPFWSLTIDAPAKQMIFEEIDTEPVRVPLTQMLISAQGFPAELHARSGTGLVRWATLTAKLCSDGMSDRLFGISTRVVLDRDDDDPLTPSGTLSGCCALNR